MASRPEDLAHGKESWDVEIWTDGTVTRTEITDAVGTVRGGGVARRSKGDKRNEKLGCLLATARAFEETVSHLYRMAEKEGYRSNALTFTEEEAAMLKESLQALIRLHKR